MVSKVFTATLLGLDCQLIDVEVDYRHGMAHFAIVGLGDKSIQEAKERIASAIRSAGAEYIPRRLIVNLAPADIEKSGPLFDLAIAAGFLLTTDQLSFDPAGKIFLGELALNGSLRAISGVLPLIDGVKKAGFRDIFLPADNALEASLITDMNIYPLATLQDLIGHFSGMPIKPFVADAATGSLSGSASSYDLADVKGQLQAKRALEIAAAGGHNLLMSGVPGAGKTLLAKCLPGILPEMTLEESLETTRIYSVANMLTKDSPLIRQRPFRAPHHGTSQAALVGGGGRPRPGEISLAHRGVLFLDEFTELNTAVMEALRQPLEDKQVSISRAAYSVKYPANFMLLAAMNPCKCGHLGDPDKECTCSPFEIARYRKRISGPILDRIDLSVQVHKVDYEHLIGDVQSETSEAVKARVQRARDIQHARLLELGLFCNSEMRSQDLKQFVPLDTNSQKLLKLAIDKFNLSARAYFRILKIVRTIADLEGVEKPEERHVAEALSFRLEL